MKNPRLKLYFIMFAIGFLCIIADIHIETGLSYPQPYKNSEQVIGEFQYYTLASNYNVYCDYKWISSTDSASTFTGSAAKVINKVYYKKQQIDLLNDFIGFLLIVFAGFRLRKCSRHFSFASFSAMFAFLIHGIIGGLPFFINGLSLCYWVFFLKLAFLLCSIVTFYSVAKGFFSMCPDVSCRDERKWCKILLLIIATTHTLITFVFWIGADLGALHTLGFLMQYVNLLLVFLFWRTLYRTGEHLEKSYTQHCE